MRKNMKALLVGVPIAGLLAGGGVATAAAFGGPAAAPVTVREQVSEQTRSQVQEQVRAHVREQVLTATSTVNGAQQHRTVQPATAGDQDRTRDRDCDQSCLTAGADQLQTRDRDQDKLHTGDQDQTRDRDQSCLTG